MQKYTKFIKTKDYFYQTHSVVCFSGYYFSKNFSVSLKGSFNWSDDLKTYFHSFI